MTDAPYQAFYCEENTWQAARLAVAAGAAAPIEAVFVSNPDRTCAVYAQRAAAARGEPVVWDYHVVLRVGGEIHDPDCVAGLRLPAPAWLAASFPPELVLPARYRPRFRRVPAERFLRTFASDRRHMRDGDGDYRQPPPPWPPIVAPDGRAHTLPAFLDFETSAEGAWLDLRSFAEALRAVAG